MKPDSSVCIIDDECIEDATKYNSCPEDDVEDVVEEEEEAWEVVDEDEDEDEEPEAIAVDEEEELAYTADNHLELSSFLSRNNFSEYISNFEACGIKQMEQILGLSDEALDSILEKVKMSDDHKFQFIMAVEMQVHSRAVDKTIARHGVIF